MKRHTEFGFANAVTGAPLERISETRTCKTNQKKNKPASAADKKRLRPAAKKLRRASGIRETKEVRALLEKQLHSLYWWVFNASKMKGFIRAKGLHEAAQRELRVKRNAALEQPEVAGDDGSRRGG